METAAAAHDRVPASDWLGSVNLRMCLGSVAVRGVRGVSVWSKKGAREVGEGEGK